MAKNVDDKFLIGVVIADLSKVPDAIVHDLLISKSLNLALSYQV